ncbi:MAG TPA: RluA family pseudouridine synthase [Candidatus Paceibacterota bacterium]|nr:RluA family pseudouridine synthase [Candidatus Paceibacterota bacterium]HPT17962.1 RluA family pseudouridine synthase [Candidatus Paceibacterota bacterium]
MKIKILYEDKDILAIDKPSGISVHADGRSNDKTIVDWFLKKYPKVKNVGEPIFVDGKEIKKPGIVHRLDRETSGVLVLAKNQKSFLFLKKQFQNREIKKIYNAIVSGSVKNDHGIINKPIGRSPSDFRRRLAGRGARGELRDAITEYKVLKRFSTSKPFTYLEVKPKTGRTHQIRVHMKYLNHPIVCDSLYDLKGFCPKNLSRMALHAKSIEFKNLKGETLKVESPIPKEFEKILDRKSS